MTLDGPWPEMLAEAGWATMAWLLIAWVFLEMDRRHRVAHERGDGAGR